MKQSSNNVAYILSVLITLLHVRDKNIISPKSCKWHFNTYLIRWEFFDAQNNAKYWKLLLQYEQLEYLKQKRLVWNKLEQSLPICFIRLCQTPDSHTQTRDGKSLSNVVLLLHQTGVSYVNFEPSTTLNYGDLLH